MKITGVSWEEYSYPHATPLKTGGHVSTHAGVAVARVFTEEGIEGVGMGAASIVGPALVGTLERELIGENPMNVERLWHKMWVPKLVGRRGMTTRVISAIDIALWDLAGQDSRSTVVPAVGWLPRAGAGLYRRRVLPGWQDPGRFGPGDAPERSNRRHSRQDESWRRADQRRT